MGDWRSEKKATLDDVAIAVGITKSTLSNYENNVIERINVDVLAKLCKYYEKPFTSLLGITERDVDVFNKYGLSEEFLDALCFDIAVATYNNQKITFSDTLNKIVSAEHSWSALVDNIGHYLNEEGDNRKIHLIDIITLLEACHGEIYPKILK